MKLNDINGKLHDAENMLTVIPALFPSLTHSPKLDKGKLRAKELREEIDRLQKKKIDLEAMIEEAKLPPAEVSKRLLKRVKADNNEIKELDKRITKLKKLINNYKKDLKDIEIDKEGKNDT